MSTKIRPITHIITGSGPVNPWPPTGSYLLCARLYTNTFLDHITVNTVSWRYDSGSSPTFADANCTYQLVDLSSWNDSSPNTVLQTTGQNEYGTYVDIFTDGSQTWTDEFAIDFCVILGNDRIQTITDDSWKITRVEVYKVGMTNGIYRTNDSPYKGQWFRDSDPNEWTEFTPTPSTVTKFRPLSVFEVQPAPQFPSVQIGNQIWMSENLSVDDGGEGIMTFNSVISYDYELGPQTYYTWAAAMRVANSIPGWHLPSVAEWDELMSYTDYQSVKSTYGWSSNNGTNTTGMNILPAGRVDPYGSYVSQRGIEANIWSSTSISDSQSYCTFIYNTSWNHMIGRNKNYTNSVRLVKD